MDANHLDYGAATAKECAISYIHGVIYVQSETPRMNPGA
jgi:hypothetical protein